MNSYGFLSLSAAKVALLGNLTITLSDGTTNFPFVLTPSAQIVPQYIAEQFGKDTPESTDSWLISGDAGTAASGSIQFTIGMFPLERYYHAVEGDGQFGKSGRVGFATTPYTYQVTTPGTRVSARSMRLHSEVTAPAAKASLAARHRRVARMADRLHRLGSRRH